MKEIFTITIELDLYHTEFFICRMSEKEVLRTRINILSQKFSLERQNLARDFVHRVEKNLACMSYTFFRN